MKITVVIATLNEEEYLEETLKTLNNQSLDRNDFQVIIIDGESSDRTVEIAKKYTDQVYSSKDYNPVGRAKSEGLNRVKTPLVAFADADTLYPRKYLKNVVSIFEENPELVCAYGCSGSDRNSFVEDFGKLWSKIAGVAPGYALAVNTMKAKKVGIPHFTTCDDLAFVDRLRSEFGKSSVQFFPELMRVETSMRRFEQGDFLTHVSSWLEYKLTNKVVKTSLKRGDKG